MFQVADIAILNKVDLLPYLDLDAALAVENMQKVHPGMPVFEISAKTEQGFEPWLEWLRERVREKINR
jgi:hydrogenase nickel incorporation protein HypB